MFPFTLITADRDHLPLWAGGLALFLVSGEIDNFDFQRQILNAGPQSSFHGSELATTSASHSGIPIALFQLEPSSKLGFSCSTLANFHLENTQCAVEQ